MRAKARTDLVSRWLAGFALRMVRTAKWLRVQVLRLLLLVLVFNILCLLKIFKKSDHFSKINTAKQVGFGGWRIVVGLGCLGLCSTP